MTLYSLDFLVGFLPLSAAAYHFFPKRHRALLLTVLGTLFYFFAAGKHFYLILPLTVGVYFLSRAGKKTAWLCVALLVLFRLFRIEALGLSFFFLRAYAYIREEHGEKNFLKAASHMLFFSSFCAGPVTRYGDTSSVFTAEKDYTLIAEGILRLLFGLVKKLFFADTLFLAFELFLSGDTALSAFMAVLCFSLYIYFDFSGYSDIAVGIFAIFCVRIPNNFYFPYASSSVGEFFRRWHISFGRWLFDFVYLAFGGSRNGRARLFVSLAAVWLFSSAWHGLSPTFFIWGGWFFLLSAFEKCGLRLGRFFTLAAVFIGWIPFFSDDTAEMLSVFKRLFALGDTLLFCRADIYNSVRFFPFLSAAAFLSLPFFSRGVAVLYRRCGWILFVAVPPLVLLILSCIAHSAHRPFLYAAF